MRVRSRHINRKYSQIEVRLGELLTDRFLRRDLFRSRREERIPLAFPSARTVCKYHGHARLHSIGGMNAVAGILTKKPTLSRQYSSFIDRRASKNEVDRRPSHSRGAESASCSMVRRTWLRISLAISVHKLKIKAECVVGAVAAPVRSELCCSSSIESGFAK